MNCSEIGVKIKRKLLTIQKKDGKQLKCTRGNELITRSRNGSEIVDGELISNLFVMNETRLRNVTSSVDTHSWFELNERFRNVF